jgi:ribosome-associated protein
MSKLIINAAIQIPFREFTFRAVRSQGPGGQNVNKVNSKVVLQWNAAASPSLPDAVRQRLLQRADASISKSGTITLTSQRSRQRPVNREDCLEKLRVMILDAARVPRKRKATQPTPGSKRRRLRDKELTSFKKTQRQSPKLDN